MSGLVTLVRNLQRRNARRRRPLAIAEGVLLIEEALHARIPIQGTIVNERLAGSPKVRSLVAVLGKRNIPIERVDDALFSELADTDSPQGMLAVVEPQVWELAQLRPERRAPVVVLDAIRDPGNVGAILRTSFSLGAAGAVLLPGTGRANHPKVLRAAMGATFRLPIVATHLDPFLGWIQDNEVTMWSTGASGTSITQLNPPERLAILLGNEAEGVRPQLERRARVCASIPLREGVDSLNAAVAAGIILHEVVRDR